MQPGARQRVERLGDAAVGQICPPRVLWIATGNRAPHPRGHYFCLAAAASRLGSKSAAPATSSPEVDEALRFRELVPCHIPSVLWCAVETFRRGSSGVEAVPRRRAGASCRRDSSEKGRGDRRGAQRRGEGLRKGGERRDWRRGKRPLAPGTTGVRLSRHATRSICVESPVPPQEVRATMKGRDDVDAPGRLLSPKSLSLYTYTMGRPKCPVPAVSGRASAGWCHCSVAIVGAP